MARLVLVLLVVMAGALVVALVRDHRRRHDERIDHLRWTFLHGRPLAGQVRAALTELVHPSGMRFRAPASWSVRMGDTAVPHAGAGRVVEVDVLRLEARAGGVTVGSEAVAAALRAVNLEGERSVETLASGNVVMKAVERGRDGKAVTAVYAWRLGHARADGGIDVAMFRLRVPVEVAGEVIVQSDLGVLDREIRAATFSDTGAS